MRRPPPKISHRSGWLAALALAGCGFSSAAGTRPGTDAGAGIDGPSIDTPSGTACLGPSGWQVCVDAFPAAAIALTGMLDTDKSELCLETTPASWTDTQSDACIIVGETVDIGAVKATGSRPLVIVGRGRITVATLLDVGSHHVGPPGPGAPSTECTESDQLPGNSPGGGGGAGGSFATAGGNGGQGDTGNHQDGHAGAGLIGHPTRLRAGCDGQPGGGSPAKEAGAGGGAVYLLSGGEIALSGVIDASGGGGSGAGVQNGGSGGGSGGMIVLSGARITSTTARLFADGGGGGGGGAATAARGVDGQDPGTGLPVAPALGGGGGLLVPSGSGGAGGNGAAMLASAIDGASGDTGAGGGGGGGGAGYIQSSQDLALAVVSPAATIKP